MMRTGRVGKACAFATSETAGPRFRAACARYSELLSASLRHDRLGRPRPGLPREWSTGRALFTLRSARALI